MSLLEQTSTNTPKLIVSPCYLLSIHDADTFRVNTPFEAAVPSMKWVPDIRLAHVNAAELSTAEGKAALQKVTDWFTSLPTTFELLIYGPDKYGRTVGDVRLSDGSLLSTFVLSLPGSAPMSLKRVLAKP